MRLRIGSSGWFYWAWKGRFYPESIPTRDWFAFYRSRFNTVELNAPFYRWPQPATVKQWRRQATRGFSYCVKVNGLITHERQFKGTATLIREFYSIAETLGPNMGCFLFQCPPSFHYSAARLQMVLRQLDPRYRNAVEFRHRSWWDSRVFSAFRKRGVIFCSVSAPTLPDDLVETTDEIYVRFHGVKSWYRHRYTDEELEEWSKRIRRSKASGAWIFFNNDFQANAIRNARDIRRLLK